LDAGPAAFWSFLFTGIGIGALVSIHECNVMRYTLHRFKKLPAEQQVDELSLHGIPFDLAYTTHGAEAVLFGYHDFYVELVVEKYTDEILSIRCFQSPRQLAPYLQQIDITEIIALLACSN
jgi:hypothetical protein